MMRCTLSSCRRSSICKASTRRDARWCTSSSLVTSPPSATSMSSSATSSTSSTTPAPDRLRTGQEKFAVVGDLRGWGYANCDIRAYVAALDIMQSCYPERLGRVLLIHVPYVIMAAWKMLYPFIDDKTKEKFVFVAGSWDLDATLRDSIDESQLPKEYEGRLELRGYNDF
uniref:CRAL-TRIO domain-containing protein n=1 Tax=Aegilops tauschii subsp. strangulata TaxID=200361 RepID=A0A453M3Z8_AEGTS